MQQWKKLSAAIILVLMTSCTIPVVQDPVPLPLPLDPSYPRIDYKRITETAGVVHVPKDVMDAITEKMALKTKYIGECRAVIIATH